MSTELGWAYEVLGVKPGVSDRELKAAHRDLAKVWHPDRFLSDPRLQEKAQEKLKEINEAYEALSTRHTRRVTPPKRRTQAPTVVRVPAQRSIRWHWWIAAPLAVFALVFAVSTKTLLRNHVQPVEAVPVAESADQSAAEKPQAARPDANQVVRNREGNDVTPAAEPLEEAAPKTQSAAPVPTVTVAIDPATGLLATPACPVKTRMTYPGGSEPRTYCNAPHLIKTEKQPRIKSLAKRVGIL